MAVRFARVTVSPKRSLLCKLRGKKPLSLDECENCGFLVRTSFRLKCHHHLCEECCAENKEFICQKDNTMTRTTKAKKETCIYSYDLQKTSLECPICSEDFKWSFIADHINECHPSVLNDTLDDPGQGLLHQPKHQNVPTPSEESGDPLTGSDDQGTPLQVNDEERSVDSTQPATGSALAHTLSASPTPREVDRDRKTLPVATNYEDCLLSTDNPSGKPVFYSSTRNVAVSHEHEAKWLDRGSLLHKFGDGSAAGFHTAANTDGHARENTGDVASGPATSVDHEDEKKKRIKDTSNVVRILQEKAKELEKKLDDIEEPLLLIIQKLRKRC